ncbi:MAG TPA: hypothetical protein VL134_07120 [Leptolyngbya sp.]|jgi:hypothetical protein|nr:hypothetical protein [Leptolyngbya sp.]
MTKHYILQLDPSAKYEWDRCSLRDPITADRPGFAELIAQAVGEQPGSYLVAVKIEVQVLEQAAPQSQQEAQREAERGSPSISEFSPSEFSPSEFSTELPTRAVLHELVA